MNLFIVDDNTGVRRLIRGIVEASADEIVECASGAEALQACGIFRPDVVLTDVVLNGMDGIALTRLIMLAHPEARVIVVSNHDDAALREAARIAGACGYILKEDLNELVTLLSSLDGDAGEPDDKRRAEQRKAT